MSHTVRRIAIAIAALVAAASATAATTASADTNMRPAADHIMCC